MAKKTATFDLAALINRHEQTIDARIMRSFLNLISSNADRPFTCEIAPENFDLPFAMLEEGVVRVLKRVGLSEQAIVSEAKGKVNIFVPAAARKDATIKAAIEVELAKARQLTSQLQL